MQTQGRRCFSRESKRYGEKQIQHRGISCVGGSRQTHLGVNPYSTDGTDLKIVTWQARKRERRQKGREGGGDRGGGMRDVEESKGREKGGRERKRGGRERAKEKRKGVRDREEVAE